MGLSKGEYLSDMGWSEGDMNYRYITQPVEQNYQDRGTWLMGRKGYMARCLFVHSSHPGRASTKAEGRKGVEST